MMRVVLYGQIGIKIMREIRGVWWWVLGVCGVDTGDEEVVHAV